MITCGGLVLLCLASQEASGDARERWLPPVKSVTLGGEAKSVGAILEAVRAQSKLGVEAFGVEEATLVQVDWKERPVLEALGDLCQKLGKGQVKVREDRKGPAAIELDGRSALPASVCHWRQFQVTVAEFVLTTQKSLEATHRSAHIVLHVTCQPGTQPLGIGEFEPLEIIDDRGWSLIKARNPNAAVLEPLEGDDPHAVLFLSYAHRADGREDQTVELLAPAPEARRIERLHGLIPMSFPMDLAEAAIPPHEMAPGKEIRIGSLKIRVSHFEQTGNKLVFEYRFLHRPPGGEYHSFPDFEIVDEKGDRLSQGSSGHGSNDGVKMEYTLSRPVPIHAVKYRAFTGRYTVMVPVDLRQIPIPRKQP